MEYQSLTPAEALSRLQEGNARFTRQLAHPPASAEEITRLDDEGQHPWAVVVACSDSRVPPELVFDCGLGELFVIRTAGHVLTEVELGSVAYAVLHLGVRLVLVLGHSHCGAVAAALSGASEPGALGQLLEHVSSAAAAAGPSGTAEERTARAERAQIRNSAVCLREDPVLAGVEGLVVAEAKYDTHTGRVAFLDGVFCGEEGRCEPCLT